MFLFIHLSKLLFQHNVDLIDLTYLALAVYFKKKLKT